jgi:hypothetical protein
MSCLRGVRAFASGSCWLRFLALAIPLLGASCGEGDGTELAAVSLTEGPFGAMLAGSDGEQLLPIVTRNHAGEPTAVTGALWMNADGSSMVVELDPDRGVPLKVVFGDFIVLFANWNDSGTVSDVARIYGPTGYVEILRNQPVGFPMPNMSEPPGVRSSAATCLPNCQSKERTQAEMLKVAGLGLSIGACGLAAVASWGAMLLPCSGTVVSGAKMVTSEDSWLNAPLERAGNLLGGIDILQCLGGDLSGCVSAALDRAAGERQKAADREEAYQALVQSANDRLMNGAIPSGHQEGDAPECIESYACTPGLTLNCVEGGTKTCRDDCTWGDCPTKSGGGGGGGACSFPDDGDTVCAGLVQSVESQCATAGGRIVAWTKSKADCVNAYKCWANGCPCLFSCGLRCGNDSNCAQSCFSSSGANMQAEAAACASCSMPEVLGQCQTGG